MTSFNANKAVGEALAALRRENKLSQEQVSKRIGTSQVAVSHYERGERPVTPDKLYAFAALYDTKVSDLLPEAPADVAKQYLKGGTDANQEQE